MKRLLILNLFCAFPLFSATATWIINNGGSWNIGGNWDTGIFPNASGDVAQLFTAITSPQPINLAQPITVGTLSIDNAFAYTVTSVSGPLTLNAPGTPLISVGTTNGSANHVISAPVVLSKASSVSVTSPATLNISGSVTGAFSLAKSGTGTLILSGATANSFSGSNITQGTVQLNKSAGDALVGSTTISGGTLELLAANQIGDAANISLQSGGFNMNGFSETLATFSWTNGTFTSGGGVLTANSISLTDKTLVDPIVFTGASRSLTFLNANNGTAVVQGNVNLGAGTVNMIVAQGTASIDMDIQSVISNGTVTISGSGGTGGTLQFSGSGSNTYTGSTSISNVALILNKDATKIAIPGNLSINTAASVTLMQDDQIVNTCVLSMASSGNPTFDLNGHNQTLRQFFYASGTFNQGVGTLTLTDSVTALQMSSTTTIPGNLVLTGGGSVVFQNTFGGSATINGNIDLSGKTTTFFITDVAASAVDMNISGGISNGAVTKIQPGTLQFSGTTPNTYVGLTTISAGALELNKTGVNAIAGNVTINGLTASLKLLQNDQIADTSTLTLTSGSFNMNGKNDTISSFLFNGGSVSNAGILTLTSASTALQMQAGTTMSGQIVLTGGNGAKVVFNGGSGSTITASINMNDSSTTYDIADGTSSIDMDIQGVISQGALTKIGAGTLQFSGGSSNTYTGVTTITAGELLLNRTATSIAGNITIDGGTLTLGTPDQIANISVITHDSGTFNRGANSETIATYIYNDGIYSQTGGTLTLADATNALTMGNKTITGALAFTGGGSAIFNGTGGTATISGNLNLGGSPTTIFNVTDGTNTAQVGGIISNGGLTKQGPGTLILTGANTYANGTIISAGVLQGNTTSLQGDITDNASLVFEQNANGTYAGSISGTGSVTKISGGTLILTGTNSYSGGTLVSAGTLQGDTTSLQGDITDNATLVFNQGSNATFTGLISGTGSLTKQGAGTLILSAANSYSGGTLISAGALQGNTTSLQGNFTDNASLIFDQAANATFTGSISGTGSLTKQGVGTLTLSAANSYSGGTLISAGVLQGNATSLQGNITDNASLIFEQNANGTFTGSISGTGSVTKISGGTLILNGTNSYTGGTLISAGGLQGNTASLQGDITDNATLIFDQNASGTYADSISGTGAFIKQGGGELILSSSNSTSGSVSVNAGTLTVNGTFAGGGTLTVGPSGILKGTGVISKVGTIQGTLAPGNSIGTIFFVGNQTFATGSTLEVELDPTTSDHVDILGSLTIQSGSTLFLMPQPGVYTAPMVYNLIHASAGVTGTFTTITSSLPLMNAVVVHAPFDVLLRLEAAFDPFTSLFNSGNAGQVAKCLDALESTPCSNLTSVINELRLIPSVEGLEEALLQLQPSQYTALAIAGENDVLYVKQALYNRLEKALHACCDEDSSHDKGTLWVTGLTSHTSQKRHGEELGFIANTPGALLAYDAPIGSHYRLGGALAYTQTHLHWKGSSDRANIQSGYGTLYGSCFNKRGYALASLMAGYNAYSIRRFIEFGVFDAIDTDAKSHHAGFETSGHLKLGLKYGCKGLVISPFGSVDYIFLHEKGFHETGAQSMNLNVSSKNSDLLSSEGGLDFSYCFRSAKGSYTPYLIVSAIRESRFYGDKENASFECGCNMTVYGYYPSRTLGGVAAGINAELFHSTFSLSYLGRYAKGYGDSTISLQYDYAF